MTASLFDAFTRQQAYLEGYKTGLEGRLDMVLRDMFADVQKVMAETDADTMNLLTRKRLNELIRAVQKLQLRRNDAFRAEMLRELRAFAQGDMRMTVEVVETHEEDTVDNAYAAALGLPLLGLLALKNTREGRARLWALVDNSPDPATGQTARELINTYLSSVTRGMRDVIVRGYANGWTVKETVTAIFGTKKNNYKDGLTNTLKRQGASMLHTVVQHVKQTVQAGVASVFYKTYEWVSVIDLATTAICRSRDGNIYRYGKGPLPPAHYRCRSTTVPVSASAVGNMQPSTFHAWLKVQPVAVQNDLVGARVARDLRSGRITAEQLGKFRARQRLTLEQYLAKVSNIIR